MSWVVFSGRGVRALRPFRPSRPIPNRQMRRRWHGHTRRSTLVVFSSHVRSTTCARRLSYAVRVGLLCLLAAVLALACDIAPTAAPTATPTPATAPAITPTPAPATTPTPAACDRARAHANPNTRAYACADGHSRRAVRDSCCPSSSPLFQSAIPDYDRGEWRHWTDEDGDCQDARQEALVAESVSPVFYTDSGRCRVASGIWVGPYTGERVHRARKVGHRPHGAPRQRPSVRRLGLEPRTEAPVRERPVLRQSPDRGASVRQSREGQQEPCGLEAARSAATGASTPWTG